MTRSVGAEQPEQWRKMPNWLSPRECSMIGKVATTGKWQTGRQGSGYNKLDLRDNVETESVVQRALNAIGSPRLFDAWLLHYPAGSSIPPHTDPAQEGMCHVRLNAIITSAAGGVLYLAGKELPLSLGDAYIFRPDRVEHEVSPIVDGSRYVLSVGANVQASQARELGLA